MKGRLKELVLRPPLSPADAERRFAEEYLIPADYDRLIPEDTRAVTPDGETLFVYVRNALKSSTLQAIYEQLCLLPFSSHTLRTRALAGSQGKETVLGWLADNMFVPGPEEHRSGPRLAAATRHAPDVYKGVLVPLAVSLSKLVRRYLPKEWRAQVKLAMRNGGKLIPGSRIFSTITVNRNAIFRAHVDAGNVGVACLTTFGHFSGGALCLPRLRTSFVLQPGDVLIANTSVEPHGNVGTIGGDRISTVFYLRAMNKNFG